LQKAIKEWQRLSQDPKTRAQYLSRLKWKMDYYSAIKTAEAKGEAKGEAKVKLKQNGTPSASSWPKGLGRFLPKSRQKFSN